MKTKFIAFLISCFTLLSVGTVSAQQEYVWDTYKMSIELPNDFKVVKNTDTEFHCDGDGMNLFMYVFDDGDVTLEQMNDATHKLGKDLQFDMRAEHYEVEHNGFHGSYILGTKDGLQVMLAGLINPKNNTNFFIVIMFEDGDHQASKDGLAILNSLENED